MGFCPWHILNKMETNLGVNVEILSTHKPVVVDDPKLKKVKIKYHEKFEGTKFHADDDIVPMSEELAKQYVDLGIGTLVEEKEKSTKKKEETK